MTTALALAWQPRRGQLVLAGVSGPRQLSFADVAGRPAPVTRRPRMLARQIRGAARVALGQAESGQALTILRSAAQDARAEHMRLTLTPGGSYAGDVEQKAMREAYAGAIKGVLQKWPTADLASSPVPCSLCGASGVNASCPRCTGGGRQLDARPMSTAEARRLAAQARTAADDAAERRRTTQRARVARWLAGGPRPVRVGLVACAKTKRDGRAPARELYASPLFRASLAYAEERCDEVWILSAFYGLVAPDTEIETYDRTLRGARMREREAWADRVFDALRQHYAGAHAVELVILAGEDYTAPLLATLQLVQAGGHAGDVERWTVDVPLRGLSIGRRLAWFKAPVDWCENCGTRGHDVRRRRNHKWLCDRPLCRNKGEHTPRGTLRFCHSVRRTDGHSSGGQAALYGWPMQVDFAGMLPRKRRPPRSRRH